MATKTDKDIEAVKEEDDRVTIMIPYIEGEDPEVTVGINGVFTKIQKGKVVRVKPAVAKVIETSNAQEMAAMENRKRFKSQVTEL